MSFFKKIFLFVIVICVLFTSACGKGTTSASTVDTSLPEIDPPEVITPSEEDVGPVLYAPEPINEDYWGITAHNEALGIEVSLMSYLDTIPLDFATTFNTPEEIIFVSLDSDFSCTLDENARVKYMSLGDGWSFLSKLSTGDSLDKAAELFFHDSGNSCYFRKDGTLVDSATNADAFVVFSGLGNAINAIRVSAINQLPVPILVADGICEIYYCTPSEPNSADGVDVSISFSNQSDRTIKYITFSVTPYNAVDDPVASMIGNKSTISLKLTGPVEPVTSKGESTDIVWETIWYNSTIKYCKIDSVTIEYMDGEIIELPVI